MPSVTRRSARRGRRAAEPDAAGRAFGAGRGRAPRRAAREGGAEPRAGAGAAGRVRGAARRSRRAAGGGPIPTRPSATRPWPSWTVVRQEEMEARLAQRTAEERARSIAGQAESLRRAAGGAASPGTCRQGPDARERRRRHRGRRGRRRGARAGTHRAVVAARRRRAGQNPGQRRTRETALHRVRARVRSCRRVGAAHRRGAPRRGTPRPAAAAAEQLGPRSPRNSPSAADELIAGYGPDVPVPPTPDEMAEYQAAKDRGDEVTAPPPMRYDRPSQERRLKRAERDLTRWAR